MRRKIVIYIIVSFLISSAIQTTICASDCDPETVTRGLSIGYWGTMINNYGVQLGLEKYRLQNERYTIFGTKSLVLQRKTGIYSSAGIILGNSLRRTYQCGIFFEQSIRLGYLGSYYDFDIYRTNSDGDIVNIGRKWLSSAILGYSAGIGYDFAKKTALDLQLFVKPNIYYRVPNYDNLFFLNNYSLEAGIVLHPGWLK